MPLAELLNALLAARLRLECVEEFGGDRDQGHVPRDLALVATKPPLEPVGRGRTTPSPAVR